MKILITGGAGFIGSHLCEALLAEGHDLAIVDDLNDFYDPSLKLQNLAEIRRKGAVPLHQIDISNDAEIAAVVRSEAPEAIIHLAARAGVRPSLEQPLLYARVNVYGTTALLEAARQHGVRRFVFASSSSVYGASSTVPFREDEPVLLPVSPYAATKLAGEKICYTYAHLYGIKCVCLRFFTVYGPRQRPDLAIRKFAALIQDGAPVPIFGDGSSGRDYTYIDDIVGGIIGALRHEAAYDIFNLGNSRPVTLATMVQTIEEALGKKATITRLPDQPGDVPITFADIGKAGRILGYCPATGFREGIEKFLEWHCNQPLSRGR